MGRWSGPGPYFEDVDGRTPTARLRAVKRAEAEKRNAKTPFERRRAYRHMYERAVADLATASKKRSKKKAA